MTSSASQDGVRTARGSARDTPRLVLLSRTLLILSALVLMLIGLVMIYSASSVEAIAEGSSPTYYLVKQFQWIVIGSIACLIATKVPYQVWLTRIGCWLPWTAVVILLVITAVSGYVGLGAQRWMGIGSFTFQPSELAKIAVILTLAALISEYEAGGMDLRWFIIKILVVIAVPALLIYIQPDLGTTIIFAFAAILALWFGGVNWKYILVGLGSMCAVGVIGIIAEPYRLTRFTTFLHPASDPAGDGYQILNSLYAFGSGGLLGVGLGNSFQKYDYLPEAHTDFIFSIIGEELGFIGCAFVILCFAVFIWAGCRIAKDATTVQGRAIAGAATGTIGLQALINIACTIGFFPVTGKPLPFVSAGGSSLLATLILVGLILSVSFHSDLRSQAQRRRDDLVVIDGGAPARKRAGKGATSERPPRREAGVSVSSAGEGRAGKRTEKRAGERPPRREVVESTPRRTRKGTAAPEDPVAPDRPRTGASGTPSASRGQRAGGGGEETVRKPGSGRPSRYANGSSRGHREIELADSRDRRKR